MAKVLVVDDSPVDRTLVCGLLKKSPHVEVVAVTNGDEAVQRLHSEQFHLVVTDLMMPRMDGLQLVAQVVAQFPLVPIVLMTGQGSEQIAVKALQVGAASYVPKTQLSDLIVETVENLLAMAVEEQTNVRLMECMSSCAFSLENDAKIIAPVISFLHRFIQSTKLCDETNGIRVCVALEEALNNAIFHGNLEISSDVREHDPKGYRRLITERSVIAPYKDRRVFLSASAHEGYCRFTVRDQGPGFDVGVLPDPTDSTNIERPRGRGLLLMRTFMDEVRYNQTGNEVTMLKYAATASESRQ